MDLQKQENAINSLNVKKDYIGVTAARGFLAAGIKAGLKKSNNYDLGCLYSVKPAVGAAVFTTNKFAAAPVVISRDQLQKSETFRLIIVNSGSANACTGEQGLKLARFIIEKSAKEYDINESEILIASTGKIGVQLPIDKMLKNIFTLKDLMNNKPNNNFSKAIMTTDTFEKKYDVSFKLNNKTITIGGCAKGAGMINPSMATMLCFITTDIAISKFCLQNALNNSVKKSFNSITVDGDMSTNDTVFLLANGMATNNFIDDITSKEYKKFEEKLSQVCLELAKMIVKDGEGATKFIQVKVENAGTYEQGKIIANLVANSSLVKTALFGCDPNWGRIVSSIGSAPFDFKPENVNVSINNIKIFENCEETDYNLVKLQKIMKLKELHINIDMGIAKCEPVIVWTTDLTYDYVKINAEYST